MFVLLRQSVLAVFGAEELAIGQHYGEDGADCAGVAVDGLRDPVPSGDFTEEAGDGRSCPVSFQS